MGDSEGTELTSSSYVLLGFVIIVLLPHSSRDSSSPESKLDRTVEPHPSAPFRAQIACAEALQRAICEGAVASESVSMLLPLMLKILGQPRPDTVTEAWLSVLCVALPKLPPKVSRSIGWG